jgi:imidazolonepropionase
MPILHHIGLLATCRAEGGQAALHAVADAVLVWQGETVVWVGPAADLPAAYAAQPRLDAGGRLVVPGLIDSHTHLAFGGWRADEFEARLQGQGYLEITRQGGGIARTMHLTRAASEDALVARCHGFLHEMACLGVTTVECKSGYGLTLADEVKLLRVYRRLQHAQPLGIVPTLLGAHVVPPEYRHDRAAYVRLLCDELIPHVATEQLAEFCDVFVEDTAFTVDEARQVFAAGVRHGLRPKLHADQLTEGGGAALAAEVGAISADHLEHASAEGLRAMADAGVVAVLLPLATLYLQHGPVQAHRFREAGVAMAVATDFNPGSAPSYHLPLAMLLACTLYGLTPAEALKGATIFAARAIGREARLGSLEPGKQADFVLIDAPDVNHWLYHFRPNAAVQTWVRGRPLEL